MQKYLGYSLIFLLLASGACAFSQGKKKTKKTTPSTVKEINKELMGLWLHSREEDTDNRKHYRPKSFAFPVSRGRTGFEFKPDGKFVEIGIAPADGPEYIPGSWKESSGRMFIITFDDPQKPGYTIKVLELSQELLIIE